MTCCVNHEFGIFPDLQFGMCVRASSSAHPEMFEFYNGHTAGDGDFISYVLSYMFHPLNLIQPNQTV